jgi:hypothetical protein
MRFYTNQHQTYCGIDLHARTMYVCILNQASDILVHQNMKTSSDALLRTIAPYRADIVVAVECMFTWYWLADLCAQAGIPFVLGHALYMQAIHGGKASRGKSNGLFHRRCAHPGTYPAPPEAISQPLSRPRGPRGRLAGRPPTARRPLSTPQRRRRSISL